MASIKTELLQVELTGIEKSATHLEYSFNRCKGLMTTSPLSPEQLESLESLTSRFARLSDLLTKRVFRLIDDLELAEAGTVLDRIYRAEKRGWLDSAQMIRIRELRNLIAHEYSQDQMTEIYRTVISLTDPLLAIVPKVIADGQKLINRYA